MRTRRRPAAATVIPSASSGSDAASRACVRQSVKVIPVPATNARRRVLTLVHTTPAQSSSVRGSPGAARRRAATARARGSSGSGTRTPGSLRPSTSPKNSVRAGSATSACTAPAPSARTSSRSSGVIATTVGSVQSGGQARGGRRGSAARTAAG